MYISISSYTYTYRYIHIHINIYIHTSSTATTTMTHPHIHRGGEALETKESQQHQKQAEPHHSPTTTGGGGGDHDPSTGGGGGWATLHHIYIYANRPPLGRHFTTKIPGFFYAFGNSGRFLVPFPFRTSFWYTKKALPSKCIVSHYPNTAESSPEQPRKTKVSRSGSAVVPAKSPLFGFIEKKKHTKTPHWQFCVSA